MPSPPGSASDLYINKLRYRYRNVNNNKGNVNSSVRNRVEHFGGGGGGTYRYVFLSKISGGSRPLESINAS